jgi:hypothetical protein
LKQKRAQEAKSLGPAQSAVEATSRMLKTKVFSRKTQENRDDLFTKLIMMHVLLPLTHFII